MNTKKIHKSTHGGRCSDSRTTERIAELLAQLERDRATVAETDIAALERDIDEAVYDLFDLTDDERAVIEEYLDVF